MPTPSTPVVALSISMNILIFLFLPFSIIWIHKIIRSRHAVIMKKRFINGSICCCVALFCWLFISHPLIHIGYLFPATSYKYKILETILHIIYVYSVQGGIYSLCFRFWMIYFEFMYAESLENSQWKVQINPKGCSKDELWIINHRKDFGNAKWIATRIIIVYLTVSTMLATLFSIGIFEAELGIIEYGIASMTDTACFLIPLITVFVLWKKMPSFLDTILVKKELRLIVIIYAVGLAWNVLTVVGLMINPLTGEPLAVVWTPPVIFICFGQIYIQTSYVFRQIHSNVHYFGNILSFGGDRELSTSSRSNTFGSHTMPRAQKNVEIMNLPSTSKSNSNKLVKLKNILQDHIAFELFMHHLSTELSTENIFAFIEFTQFRNLLKNDEEFMSKVNEYIDENKDDTTILKQEVSMSRNQYKSVVLLDEKYIPLSHIVHVEQYNKTNGIDRYKAIVVKLAQKYIDNSADFCINISYNERLRIQHWINIYCTNGSQIVQMMSTFGIKEQYEMMNIFENCRKEMFQLMTHINERFVKTAQFQKFQESK